MTDFLQNDYTVENLDARGEEAGFSFVPSRKMREIRICKDTEGLSDWEMFASSWNELPLDLYMADGGR